MKHSLIALSVVVGLGLGTVAYANDPFAELDQEMNKLEQEGTDKEMAEFQKWKKDYLAEYQQFRKEHFNRLDDIRDKLINKWGESEVSTAEKHVAYEDNIRSVFDFETNQIRISVLHDKDKEVEQELIKKALTSFENQGLVKQMTGINGGQLTINKLIDKANKKSHKLTMPSSEQLKEETKLIEEQSRAQKVQVERLADLANADLSDAERAKADAKTEQMLTQQKQQIDQEKKERLARLQQKLQELRAAKAADQMKKTEKEVTTYTIDLGKRKELKMAKPFIPSVLQQAKRWELEPSLMLAIMHTESHFNPKAKSHIPAFGLMQIVPRTASIDVNRLLYKSSAPMTASELFRPRKNIETGVAYMHILNSRYLKAIKNEESRRYCMIAAYNTGSGNVAKTFNPDRSRNINKAAKVINQMSPQQVYDRLLANLPYDETKHYVERVTKRKNIYTQLDAAI